MGKKKKKRQQSHNAVANTYGADRHHLIFQGRHYNKGYGKLLREHCVRMLKVTIHRNLHNTVISDITRPTDKEVKEMWLKYQDEQEMVDNMDIVELCDWLYRACDNPGWRECMKKQYDYLKSALGYKNKGE